MLVGCLYVRGCRMDVIKDDETRDVVLSWNKKRIGQLRFVDAYQIGLGHKHC